MVKSPTNANVASASGTASAAPPEKTAPPASAAAALVDTVLIGKVLHEGVFYRPGVVYRMDAATRAAADIAPLIKKS